MSPHKHEHPAVSFVLKGSFRESADGEIDLACSAKALIKPEDLVHSDSYDQDCTILCIYLKDKSVIYEINKSVFRNWSSLYNINWLTFNSYLEQKKYREKKIELNDFVKKLGRSRMNHSDIPDWIYSLKQYLDLHFNENVQTSFLADKFEVHPVYLARVFRKYFGQSVKSYLRSIRIKNSMSSMITSSETFTRIAMENGFADQSHFIRNFKAESGSTPKQFRKILS